MRRADRMAVFLGVIALTASTAVTPPVGANSERAAAARDSGSDRDAMRADFTRLAGAWAEGGGTYGYPFWEKAGHRWHDGELSTSMYREYVTSYREMLKVGCDGIRATNVDTEEGATVRATLHTACSERLDALGAQQRMLELLMPEASADAASSATDLAARREQRDRADLLAQQGLQESYRATRLSMGFVQRHLDSVGLDRIAEDAFV